MVTWLQFKLQVSKLEAEILLHVKIRFVPRMNNGGTQPATKDILLLHVLLISAYKDSQLDEVHVLHLPSSLTKVGFIWNSKHWKIPFPLLWVRLRFASAMTTENQSSRRLPMACNAEGEHSLLQELDERWLMDGFVSSTSLYPLWRSLSSE